MEDNVVTFVEWKHAHPERWARIEGTITHDQTRTLKFLDAQIHLTRQEELGISPPDTPEVRWLRRCVTIYLHVMANGIFPTDQQSVMWVKNQRRAHLCEYQMAALQQIPGWQWAPRRADWNERAADLDDFRREYGREPRIRAGWDYERALAYWAKRQRVAAGNGKLSPGQQAQLEGRTSCATGELEFRLPQFAGSYEGWFREFWSSQLARRLVLGSESGK